MVRELGRQAAALAGRAIDADQIEFWRRVIRNVAHRGGQSEASHPYQVLLRLVGRKPAIPRAKCALALEARDDSPEELDRIVALADLSEDEIRRRTGMSEANWANAKKVLPSLAEQLNDVIVARRRGEKIYRLADAPGRADAGPAPAPVSLDPPGARTRAGSAVQRTPRTSRQVTPETIGRAGTAENFDDGATPATADPVAVAEGIRQRRDRLRRHIT